MIQPNAYILGWFFTGGNADYDDLDLCNMSSYEAALYFAIYWLIWPFLILVYVPMAVLLSPVYAVVLTIDAFAWLIEVLEDGEDINARVDEADEQYDDAVDSRDYDPEEEEE